jgi:hypothetical protein
MLMKSTLSGSTAQLFSMGSKLLGKIRSRELSQTASIRDSFFYVFVCIECVCVPIHSNKLLFFIHLFSEYNIPIVCNSHVMVELIVFVSVFDIYKINFI